jgi:hypothetical protein
LFGFIFQNKGEALLRKKFERKGEKICVKNI